MKQKMVIKLQVDSDDDRSRAMKIAVTAYGSMERGDALVVIGEGVDPVTLTVAIRKKIRCADLVLLVEMKPEPTPEEKEKEKEKQKEKEKEEKEKKKEEKPPEPCCQKLPVCQPSSLLYWQVIPDPQPTGCSFM